MSDDASESGGGFMSSDSPTGIKRRSAFGGWLDAIAAIAMIAASGAILYVTLFQSQAKTSGGPTIAIPTKLQSLEGASVRGVLAARVAIIEYSDFQCPFCGRFAKDALVTLEKEYVDSGRVLLAFRHLPLAIHPSAQKAAEAAECAAREGKFWQMHDKLFNDPKQLGEATLITYAASIGIPNADFAACLAGQTSGKVNADSEHAAELGIQGTPTFLIGIIQAGGAVKISRVLSGARPISEFRTILDELLITSAR